LLGVSGMKKLTRRFWLVGLLAFVLPACASAVDDGTSAPDEGATESTSEELTATASTDTAGPSTAAYGEQLHRGLQVLQAGQQLLLQALRLVQRADQSEPERTFEVARGERSGWPDPGQRPATRSRSGEIRGRFAALIVDVH
jgi:hypothetical protein